MDTHNLLKAPLRNVENSAKAAKQSRNSLPLVIVRQLRDATIMTSHEVNGGFAEADDTHRADIA